MGPSQPKGTKERENPLLVDVSMAVNSAHALQMVEEYIKIFREGHQESQVNLNAGDVYLTPNVLGKMKNLCEQSGFHLETVYSKVPQTQQAALDEGFFVKEKPLPLPEPKRSSKRGAMDIVAEVYRKAPPPEVPPLLESVDASFIRTTITGSPGDIEKLSQEMVKDKVTSNKGEEPAEPADTFVSSEPVAELPKIITGETLYLKQTVRSGRVIHFDGNIVIIGDVHIGSELKASGDITVWGELRGIAHAGANGNYQAEIRAIKIDALQLRIADYIARRPDRIYYHKDAGDTVLAAELAKVSDGEIRIFKEIVG